MALLPGRRLGAYEILAPLGAGGMGEIYRATDTKLGREFAIKVLPTGRPRAPRPFPSGGSSPRLPSRAS